MCTDTSKTTMLRKIESGKRQQIYLRLDTVLVSQPEIRARLVQPGVPFEELRSGDAGLGLDLETVVACLDGVVFLAGGSGIRVNGCS
jgi:hypothetical protein